MNHQDPIGITFFNNVSARGLFNHVVNLTLSAYNFNPNDSGKVDIDPVIVARLRTDKMGAIQLRDVLNELIQMLDNPTAPAPAETEEEKTDSVILNGSEATH